MKKIVFYLTALFVTAAVISCGLVDFSVDETYVAAPTVNYDSANVVSVSVPYYVGCKYINVIRYEVNGSSSSADKVKDTTFNIGQIIPKNGYQDTKGVYTFYDYYVDSTKFYQYYLQYMTSSGHVVSRASGTVAGKGTEGEKIIAMDGSVTSIRIDYNTESGIIKMEKSLFSIPNDRSGNAFKQLKIALTNGTLTQLFNLSDSGTGEYMASLKTLLPDSFIGRSLSIKGFVGEEEDSKPGHYSDDKDDYFRWIDYYWTKPLSAEKVMLYIDNDTTTSDFFTVAQIKDEEDTYDYMIE